MTRLTLSFDNGPVGAVTSAVLDLLGARGVAAYFFVLGKHLEGDEGRALVRRALAEGHRVGNHSYSHETPLGDDPRADAVEREIVRTAALLDPLTAARSPRLFRPFGGGGKIGRHLLSEAAARHLVREGYSCVLWNSVPVDWDDPEGWLARAVADAGSREHVVMVLHDIPNACLARLPDFLDAVVERGVELTQELPADCVPLEAGVPRDGWTSIVRAGRR